MAAPESKTSKRIITARLREQRALALRLAGANYETIAERVGYRHAASAYNAVKRALARSAKESEADREAVRKLELARLDAMLLGLWPQASRGHQGAVDRVLRIMARRAALLALDAPLQVTTPPGRPIETKRVDDDPDRVAAILGVLAEVGALPAGAGEADSAADDQIHPPDADA